MTDTKNHSIYDSHLSICPRNYFSLLTWLSSLLQLPNDGYLVSLHLWGRMSEMKCSVSAQKEKKNVFNYRAGNVTKDECIAPQDWTTLCWNADVSNRKVYAYPKHTYEHVKTVLVWGSVTQCHPQDGSLGVCAKAGLSLCKIYYCHRGRATWGDRICAGCFCTSCWKQA